MLVIESRRTRHLILRLDSGEVLPAALQQALDVAEARAAWVTGVGTLEAAEIVLFDQQSRHTTTARRLDAPWEIVALTGNAALQNGTVSLRLSATLARETDLGLEVCAGQLVWARCHSVELHIVAFDDVGLTRVVDERTRLAILQPAAGVPVAAALVEAVRAAAAALPTPVETQTSPPVPIRQRPREEPEAYPEPGDLVNHFHFGECTVIESDGDRIRLRQDKDGRVREVALTMLRIGPPTLDQATSKRHFQLARKN